MLWKNWQKGDGSYLQYVGKWEGLEYGTESVYNHYEFMEDGSYYFEQGDTYGIYNYENGTYKCRKDKIYFKSDSGRTYHYVVTKDPEYDVIFFYTDAAEYVNYFMKCEEYSPVGDGYYD